MWKLRLPKQLTNHFREHAFAEVMTKKEAIVMTTQKREVKRKYLTR